MPSDALASPSHTSLLRAEAQTRARLLRVRDTTVDLDLTEAGSFTSTTTIAFECALPGESTFVDFKGMELRSATLNGRPVDLQGWQRGRLPLHDLAADNTLVVSGLMAYSHDGEGLHRHVDPADQQTYLYAMSFLDAAPRWFACFDQPDLKSTYTFDVRAPEAWTVIGNGPSRRTSAGRWRIRAEHPLSTYFVTLVAGPYASVYDSHRGPDGERIELGLHVRATLAENLQAEAADIFAVTKSCFDYYHRVFGRPYPFGEYHQAFVPDFNAGAMENPGCITFRDTFIYRARATQAERATRAGVIAHEMAHQWFGDLVTMTWWDDLWLNESFAEYMAHRCCSEATRYPLWTEFGILRKAWGSVADQAPSTHPVAGNGAVDAESALQDFDGISYAKGAALLRQLDAFITDDVFLAGLRHYFDAHAFGNAELRDLLSAWTDAGAEGLDEWAAQWLRTSGMDTISASVGEPAGPAAAAGESVTLRRHPPVGSAADRTHALQIAGFDGSGVEVARAGIRLGAAAESVHLPRSALVVPDSGDATWAKIRFPDGGWSAVPAVLLGTPPAETRVVIYNAIRDAVRDAELDPALALDLVCSTVAAEPADVVVATMLRFARDVLAGPYAHPADRPARLATVAATARALLLSAAPGSDRQLVAFRATIGTNSDRAELESWLAGRCLPDGVALDPELTWAIVERLASLGAESRLIDDVLARDPTASAQVHAARARASRPDPAAKDSAWQVLTGHSELSAYEIYAAAEGFFLPSQEDLTESYVRRYFADVPHTATFRTGWVLGHAAWLAYPVGASDEAVGWAEDTLRRTDLAPPIRRSLEDGTDELRRAVTARSSWKA
jgi:aminopeptidase N